MSRRKASLFLTPPPTPLFAWAFESRRVGEKEEGHWEKVAPSWGRSLFLSAFLTELPPLIYLPCNWQLFTKC